MDDGIELRLPGIPIRSLEKFDRNECLAAIRGQAVPNDLKLAMTRCSVIRGIRCHLKFATSKKVEELCAPYPEFSRAHNARLIMSNEIPDGLEDPVAQPYCIWHPDFATEDTYRKLADQYPTMRYQVGRACAAAGYADLYKELDLLPDVSIAEEARESKTEGGDAIYRTIMAASVRYEVMNDATRSTNLDHPKLPAYLNGDTDVRWRLSVRRPIPDERAEADFVETDIEEDRGLGEVQDPDKIPDSDYISIEESALLYSPLPHDLPTIKKDLLIQMAAYEGNIDRYARLMRPHYMTDLEFTCVIRGIFHHTMFARWWADQLRTNRNRIQTPDRTADGVVHRISQAINARRIMINDISTFNESTEHLPNLIWWPLQPLEYTLSLLAKQCPAMKLEIAIACIKCNYQRLFTSLDQRPHPHLRLAAQQSPNPFYLQDIDKRAAELGESLYVGTVSMLDSDAQAIDEDMEPTGNMCAQPLSPHYMCNPTEGHGTYFGERADPSMVELYVWQDQDLLRKFERLYGLDAWNGALEPTVADSDEETEDTT